MKNEALFSSKSDEWETPQDFYNELNKEFAFTLDPCGTQENHKCKKFFTAEENGLLQDWGGTGYFATHHIARLRNGWKRHTEKPGKTIPLLCF